MKKPIYHFIFWANLAIIAAFWWQGSGSLLPLDWGFRSLALGRLVGLLAVFFVLVQVMLMSRVRFLEGTWGLDRLSILHHKIGQYLIVFILVHPILIIFSYSYQISSFWQQLLVFLKGEDTLQAFVAVLLFLFVVVYSILIVKRKWNYEKWYFTHLSVYLAILLAFGHQLGMGGDFLQSRWFTAYWYVLYGAVAGTLLVYRFARPAWNFYRHRFKVARIVRENANVASVYITGNNMENFAVQAGQFVIVRFLSKQLWWQAHPFSISAVPNGRELRLTIKGLGDFTQTVPTIAPGTQVVIDGPHGIFTASRATKEKQLLIAGGIGITPVRSVLEQMLKAGKDAVLLYAARTEGDLVLRDEIEALHSSFRFTAHYILSDDPAWQGPKGYISKELVEKLVPDAEERELYLCAPPAMAVAMRKIADELKIPKPLVHFEKFSLQ